MKALFPDASYEDTWDDHFLYIAIERIVATSARKFSFSELVYLFNMAIARSDLSLKSQALDLMQFCRTKETTELLRSFFSQETDENFEVGLLWELWRRDEVECDDFVVFIHYRRRPLVRQLAARYLVLLGEIPFEHHIANFYKNERDIQVKMNFATILFLVSCQQGAPNTEYYRFVKQYLSSDDLEIQSEAVDCLEFMFPQPGHPRIEYEFCDLAKDLLNLDL